MIIFSALSFFWLFHFWMRSFSAIRGIIWHYCFYIFGALVSVLTPRPSCISTHFSQFFEWEITGIFFKNLAPKKCSLILLKNWMGYNLITKKLNPLTLLKVHWTYILITKSIRKYVTFQTISHCKFFTSKNIVSSHTAAYLSSHTSFLLKMEEMFHSISMDVTTDIYECNLHTA